MMTAQEALQSYLSYHSASASKTRDNIRNSLGHFPQWLQSDGARFNGSLAESLCTEAASAYCDWLQRTQSKSESALRRVIRDLQTWSNWNVGADLLAPADNALGNHTLGTNRITRDAAPTPEEVMRLLTAIPAHALLGITDRATIALLVWQALELPEINRLQRSDVDLERGTIRVATADHQRGGLRGEARRLAPEAAEHLRTYIEARRNARERALWVGEQGAPRTIWGQKLNKRLARYAATAGLHALPTTHSLRVAGALGLTGTQTPEPALEA